MENLMQKLLNVKLGGGKIVSVFAGNVLHINDRILSILFTSEGNGRRWKTSSFYFNIVLTNLHLQGNNHKYKTLDKYFFLMGN